MHQGSTLATTIWHTIVAKMATQGKVYIYNKEKIAYIVERGDAENDIVGSTNGKQSAKIDYGIAKRKLIAHIVDSSQANEQHRPH